MAKLILDIEPGLISYIKTVADKKHISLSELAANLFRKEMGEGDQDYSTVLKEGIPDWVKDLTLSKQPTPNSDTKKEYGDHIARKYQAY